MNRSVIFFAAIFVLGFGLFFFLSQHEGPEVSEEPRVGPEVVPLGESVVQYLPDETGTPRKWKLTKKVVPRERLPDEVLPQPAPRALPPDVRTEAARTLNAQAMEAWRTGDGKAAIRFWEEAIAADPEDPAPRMDYGRFLTFATDYEKAYPHLERAAELAPNDPQVWVDLLNLYERDILLERAGYARQRADEFSHGRPLVRDEQTQMWVFEGGKVLPY